MKTKSLIYNAVIYTQADKQVANSMAVYKNKIVAVGNNLEHDEQFKKYTKYNLKGKTIIPGLTDAHTHFFYFALSFGKVHLDGVDTIEKCLSKIKLFSKTLSKNEWIIGEGFSPDRLKKYMQPDKKMLDKVTGDRPAFIFYKDMHSAWVNSKAIELAKIDAQTKDPFGGTIVKFESGEPTGIFRESAAYNLIYKLIPLPAKSKINKLYKQALEHAYKHGVTSVHSFDSPKGFEYFAELTEKNKLGIRVNYYFPAASLDDLVGNKVYYGTGNDFLRLAGIKIFSDGALGSQTALCSKKYIGSKDNFGIEVTTVKDMVKHIKKAGKLGFPCAIHAIGDKAVANVLDAFAESVNMHFGARHRIEHLQLVQKKDLNRIKDMNIVCSMQPSHLPSDIGMMRKYWGKRGDNAFIFHTLQKKNIALAFGSDVPIEPLDPLDGIRAAVTRAKVKSRDVFNAKEKISAEDALFHFTAGAAYAVGQEHCRGYLIEGYPADFVVLTADITKIAISKLHTVNVLATILDGKVKYQKNKIFK
ncbi:MAG: amidohydrolase [Calditrichaeota bacterium]|nr:MAG: amidohydrolase [Calditrichota bacterium]